MTIAEITLRQASGTPDFQDFPWHLPLAHWQDTCTNLEELPRGLSRHTLIFITYNSVIYTLKETSSNLARKEFEQLCLIKDKNLPSVTPVGFVISKTNQGETGILITHYLDRSIPYRTLFMRENLGRYREHLLDAIAGLLVQLHLAGVYWGDCSLSNTLFRRDAGALRAYLVDAETAEIPTEKLPPTLRIQDLMIMEENVDGDIADLDSAGLLATGIPIADTSAYIRVRYQRLWEEITRVDIVNPNENYRIQERIRALNSLGFSVGGVELTETDNGNQLHLRVVVTDRNFHRDQLNSLTGLFVEEMQARRMMNEIQELKATLSQTNNRSTPLSVAAFYWLENVYQPVVNRLQPLVDEQSGPAELYCQVLEHKWYLSERAQRDVGHQAAAEDYLLQFGNK